MRAASLLIHRRRANLTAIGLGILAAAMTAQVATADYHGNGNVDTRVAVQDFAFTPENVTVGAGTSVVWEVRKDPEQHTVTPVEPDSFTASGQLFDGDDYAVQFNDPGRYDYACSLHPFMTGTIIVEAVAAATLTATPSASDSVGALPGDSILSPVASPPVDSVVGASDGTGSVLILAVILIIGVASVGTLIRRRSTRHMGEGDPPG